MIFSQSKDNKERKQDRRTIYTRNAITNAYIQLLKQKPKEKIKVTELCRIAEINRCTFYLHFEDINDVERTIEEDLFHKFQKYVDTQKPDVKNRESISDDFLDTILHDDIYVTLMSSVSKASFFPKFMESYYLDYLKSSLSKDQNLTEREQELLYLFIVGGVTAIEQNWIMNDSDIKKENRFLDKMVQHIMSISGSKIPSKTGR